MKRAWVYALCVVLWSGASSLLAAGSAHDRASAQDAPRHARRAHGRHTSKAGREKSAQTAEPGSAAPLEKKKKKKRRNGREKAGTPSEERTALGPPAKTEAKPSAAAQAAQAAASGVNAQIVKEGDTSVKMMEFTGLGIEGRLKSPQLVYFVQRVRAEFEHPVLPHRSFMPELEDTTGREPIR